MNVASSSSVVKIHSWPDGQLQHVYNPCPNVTGAVKSISWGKDGTWMALLPNSGQAEVISIKDSVKRLHTVKVISHPTCVAFQKNTKKNVAVGYDLGQVCLYDMKIRGVRKVMPCASSNVFYLEYTAKDSHLIGACDNGEIIVYSNMTFTMSKFNIPKSSTVTTVRCHPNKRNLIAAGSREGFVDVWDINVNKTKYCTKGHEASVSAVAFSPIASALIITSGLDRQFCFFDANANVCVTKNPVDNNVTALDFCPDGTTFALGCQDGRIAIYDARMMDSPVKSFVAHDSQINQLVFKKLGLDDSLPNYAIDDTSEQSAALNKSSSLESFALYMNVATAGSQNQSQAQGDNTGKDAGDSFMDALGLTSNSTMPSMMSKHEGSLSVSDSIKKWMDTKPCPVGTPSPVQIGFAKEVEPLNTQRPTSTPIYLTNENDKKYLSPIISFNNSSAPTAINSASLPDMQKLIKEAVKEVVSSEIEKLRKEIKYDLFEMSSGIRRQFLDLQMSVVKEFVEMENKITKVKNEILDGDAQYTEDALMEENYRLRTEISLLRDKFNNA